MQKIVNNIMRIGIEVDKGKWDKLNNNFKRRKKRKWKT